MAHTHNVVDTDVHYKIDGITRTITNINETKRELVQNDHNSERLTFEIPRYVDGHDFAECTTAQVHYENCDKLGKVRHRDVYIVNDLRISDKDENVVLLSWLISRNATGYVGTLNFSIRFACESGAIVDYAWNTTTFRGIKILEALYNTEQVFEAETDAIAALKQELREGAIDLALPKVTSANDGMALIVQNGEWQVGEIPSNIRATVSITLKVSDWVDKKQTIEVIEVSENSTVIVSAESDSMKAYMDSGVLLKSADIGTVEFTCVTVPTKDLNVSLHIIDALVMAGGGSVDITEAEAPLENGKFVMRDAEGNLSAMNPAFTEYPNKIFFYEHESNYAVRPTSLDIATGVWTAASHGLTSGQQVFATMEPSFHVGEPYKYLPGGLTLGTVGVANGATRYYVTVVDENSFYLSTASGGAALTFTEVSTMDLSKFHFEVWNENPVKITGITGITELFIVVHGKCATSFRYVTPNNYINYSGKHGVANYDKGNGGDQYGSNNLGMLCGWGYMYATIEMKFIGDKHLLQITNMDNIGYDTTNVPTAYHNRTYLHRHMKDNYIESVSFYQGGQLMNGTIVEVYTK